MINFEGPHERTIAMLRAYYSWTATGENPTTFRSGREYADGAPVTVCVRVDADITTLSDDGQVRDRFTRAGLDLTDNTVARMARLTCTSWGAEYVDGAVRFSGEIGDELHHCVAGFSDLLLALDGLRVGLSGKVRLSTPEIVNEDGSTTYHVKRCCNGCGSEIGDITRRELACAVVGAPLPDVTDECGCGGQQAAS